MTHNSMIYDRVDIISVLHTAAEVTNLSAGSVRIDPEWLDRIGTHHIRLPSGFITSHEKHLLFDDS